MVRLVRLEQHQNAGAEVSDTVVTDEMRRTSGDDGVDGEEAGGAVVGMKSPPFPRVVPQHDIRTQLTDPARQLGARLGVVGELAVDRPEEENLARRAERLG